MAKSIAESIASLVKREKTIRDQLYKYGYIVEGGVQLTQAFARLYAGTALPVELQLSNVVDDNHYLLRYSDGATIVLDTHMLKFLFLHMSIFSYIKGSVPDNDTDLNIYIGCDEVPDIRSFIVVDGTEEYNFTSIDAVLLYIECHRMGLIFDDEVKSHPELGIYVTSLDDYSQNKNQPKEDTEENNEEEDDDDEDDDNNEESTQ